MEEEVKGYLKCWFLRHWMKGLTMRFLFCGLLAYSTACVGFYRIPPDQLYRVSQKTYVRDQSGDVKELRIAKVYATLNDGREVAVSPHYAQDLFFDVNLDESADLELAVTHDPAARRSALIGCGFGLVAAGTLGLASSRSCDDFIDGPNGGEVVASSNCSIDLDDAMGVLVSAGLFFCPLSSGLSLLWHRHHPTDVDVLPRDGSGSPYKLGIHGGSSSSGN
jgi:hypothetical protein